jgi:hypothetical protein
MLPTTRNALLLSALFAVVAVAPGCKGSVPQPPRVASAGLRIDVLKAGHGKQKVDVKVKIWNDHDMRVNFELGDVRLLFNGSEVSPVPKWTRDQSPDVQAKSTREFSWTFDIGDVVGEGTYTDRDPQHQEGRHAARREREVRGRGRPLIVNGTPTRRRPLALPR